MMLNASLKIQLTFILMSYACFFKIVLPVKLCIVFFLSLCCNLLSRSLILSSKCIFCFLIRSSLIAISLKKNTHFISSLLRWILVQCVIFINKLLFIGRLCNMPSLYLPNNVLLQICDLVDNIEKVLPTSSFSVHTRWKTTVKTCIRVFRKLI